MLSEETKEYWKSANVRLSEITGDTLDSVFNRFNATFTLYNRLYDEVPAALEAKGIVIAPKIRNQENQRAVVLSIQFLGINNIVDALTNKGLLHELEGFATLINQHTFSISFDRHGVHDRQADLTLATQLQSLDNEIRITALFSLIYQVRNNYIHARKHYEQHQLLLLEPINSILTIINEILFIELGK